MKCVKRWALAAMLVSFVGCVPYVAPRRGYYDDSQISSAVQSNLYANGFRNVQVDTEDRTVYLEGFVRDRDARRDAGRIAQRTAGVYRVVNNVEVRNYRAGDAPEDWDPPRHRHDDDWRYRGH